MGNGFRLQIERDIQEYKAVKGKEIPDLQKNEWAFNYWILDKFFYEDEELIVDRITDYKDNGIDCYEWYEDTKELYLIQNKYYDAKTKLPLEYVKNTFLTVPLAVLKAGTYNRSKQLQEIYNKYSQDPQFTVRLQLYVTNDLRDSNAITAINEFNKKNGPTEMAEIYYLEDIEKKWYGEARESKKTLSVEIESVNGSTILSINNADYGLNNGIDAKYALVPVTCIFRMMEKAKEKGYTLFEENIREYLGNQGLNKNIYMTLKDENERKNFFYYNNGITMICDDFSSVKQQKSQTPHVSVVFTVKNPQIVNGCQTVSSIYTALVEHSKEDVDRHFKDTFVMLKILHINPNDEVEKKLSKAIVKYNNSQNSIDEKSFTANAAIFQRIKKEFESKGYILLIKQSDKNTAKETYSKKANLTKFVAKSMDRRELFGLNDANKLKDLMIPLEKLLQVIIAYRVGGLAAYTQKKDMLKPGKDMYNRALEFIKSSNITSDVLLSLYLLFVRLEKEKKIRKNREIIPFYIIDAFRKFECKNDDDRLPSLLCDKQNIERIVESYCKICNGYAKTFMQQNNVDYIKMIKMEINYEKLKEYVTLFNEA